MRQQISAGVNGGMSGGSSMHRPGSEDPHRRQRKFITSVEKGKLAKSNWNVYTVERKKTNSKIYRDM